MVQREVAAAPAVPQVDVPLPLVSSLDDGVIEEGEAHEDYSRGTIPLGFCGTCGASRWVVPVVVSKPDLAGRDDRRFRYRCQHCEGFNTRVIKRFPVARQLIMALVIALSCSLFPRLVGATFHDEFATQQMDAMPLVCPAIDCDDRR